MHIKNFLPTNLREIEIRKAKEKDVFAISQLTIGENLIFRSPEEVELLLPCYHIAEEVKTGKLAGCISTKMYGLDAEIVSFRVEEQFFGLGIGKALFQKQLHFLLGRKSISRIFALTTRKVASMLFLRAGFVEVGIQLFGPKVLLECAKCQKNVFLEGKHLCDEIAVLYNQN